LAGNLLGTQARFWVLRSTQYVSQIRRTYPFGLGTQNPAWVPTTQNAVYLKSLGVNIRPYLKTTKSPVLAKKLIVTGAKRVYVAKFSEAEIIAAENIKDLLITYEIIRIAKISRLVELFR
jgi:hypothetical protein